MWLGSSALLPGTADRSRPAEGSPLGLRWGRGSDQDAPSDCGDQWVQGCDQQGCQTGKVCCLYTPMAHDGRASYSAWRPVIRRSSRARPSDHSGSGRNHRGGFTSRCESPGAGISGVCGPGLGVEGDTLAGVLLDLVLLHQTFQGVADDLNRGRTLGMCCSKFRVDLTDLQRLTEEPLLQQAVNERAKRRRRLGTRGTACGLLRSRLSRHRLLGRCLRGCLMW